MGLFEYLLEGHRSDRMGGVGIGGPGSDQPGWFVLMHFAASATLTAAAAAGLHFAGGPYTPESWVLFATIYLVYLLIAWLIRPSPDMDNLGLLGGFWDHPFRWSDDVNRYLLFFAIVLAPGRFVAQGIVDTVLLPFRRWG